MWWLIELLIVVMGVAIIALFVDVFWEVSDVSYTLR